MQENRNNNSCFNQDSRSTVCIDTMRVLDSCKDRDCFEDVRVYVTEYGEEILRNTTNVRTRSAELIWTYVGVDQVPFNKGFYQITVKYYIRLELEACVGMGNSQTFTGIAVAQKDVILYGGEGCVTTYSSSPENNYCRIGDIDTVKSNDPVAYVDTVEPIVLGTRIKDCSCPCYDTLDIPECLCECLNGEIVNSDGVPRLYVSIGIFSIIKIERPTQILVQATDYSVPDKECTPATNEDNPCALFSTMPFPTNQFRNCSSTPEPEVVHRGSCGCCK